MGFPRRHAGRPRGRCLPRLGGVRLGRRAADRVARRPARPRRVPTLARHRRGRRHRRAGARRQPGAAPDGRLRRGDQQRRPQGRPHAADARRPHLRRRSRRLLLHATTSCARVLWGWRGTPLADDALETLAGSAHRARRRTRRQTAGLITPREVAATRRRIERLLRFGVYPQPSDDWPAIPWPPF